MLGKLLKKKLSTSPAPHHREESDGDARAPKKFFEI
jgi:hypothetical protein